MEFLTTLAALFLEGKEWAQQECVCTHSKQLSDTHHYITRCTSCEPSNKNRSLSLDQILEQRLKPLGIPAFSGSMFGTEEEKERKRERERGQRKNVWW